MAKKKRKNCPHCNNDYAANYISKHIETQHPEEFEPNPAHRPSDYDPKYIDKVDEYLSKAVDKETRVVKYEGEKSTGYEDKIKVQLPTIEGFAKFIGVVKSTLHEWAKDNEDFSNALTRIKEEQKQRLIDKGLEGTYQSNITALLLSGNHGLKDRKDFTSKGEKMSLTELAKQAEEDE